METIKRYFEEFKTFAIKGNVLDLAVAVIIGTAFGKIITSLVEDLVMPLIGLLGNVDFSTWIVLDQVRIGNFLNNVVNFSIVAASMFVVIKFIHKTKKVVVSKVGGTTTTTTTETTETRV